MRSIGICEGMTDKRAYREDADKQVVERRPLPESGLSGWFRSLPRGDF